MEYRKLVHNWTSTFNKHYVTYTYEEKEPRYGLKTFFLNSYYLFKTFGGEWNAYLEKYSEIFKRDPASDYYRYRDPLVDNPEQKRLNALEWTTLFEIVAQVGYPYNKSAKDNLLYYAKDFLSDGMKSPDSKWIDFMLSSAVSNLPKEFSFIIDWLPSQISEYIKKECTPHQYLAYLGALKTYENHEDLKDEILRKLISWIKSPRGNPQSQLLIWARLFTRFNWLFESREEVKEEIRHNFLQNLEKVRTLDWSYYPMFLESYYLCSDEQIRNEILSEIQREVAPSSFLRIKEIFPFVNKTDEALEYDTRVKAIKEKCTRNPTQEMCKNCATNRIDDCWIRIISKVTNTEPKPHSGFEVADVVIYTLEQGIFIVIKAEPIKTFVKEGDALARQCISLFSHPHALVLYLNPHESSPHIIGIIRVAAANARTNPRFEVVDLKYIRQIYKKYGTIELF